MLYNCRGFLWHNIWMSISEEDWDMSITSKSVSVQTTDFLSVCAKVSAVDTMRWSASAGSCFTNTPARCSSVVNLSISLALFLLLARESFWVVVVFTSHANRMSANMDWVVPRCCQAALVDAELLCMLSKRIAHAVFHFCGMWWCMLFSWKGESGLLLRQRPLLWQYFVLRW